MRLLFIILFFYSAPVFATRYYVANAGNDSNDGITTGTAFQTIAKALSVAISGDQISLNKGDVFYEKCWPTVSNLTIDNYGTGVNPLISGFQTLTFTNLSGNIWTAPFANSVPYQNTVFLNGALRAKGRYPNTTLLATTYCSPDKSKLKVTGSSGIDYTRGEVVMQTQNWISDRALILSQNVDTFTIVTGAKGFTYQATGSVFIQNLPLALDVQNEWSDTATTTTHTIYAYSTTQPTGKASAIDTLIYIYNLSNITISGIAFEGANTAAIRLNKSTYSTINNCQIKYSGIDGIRTDTACHYLTINRCRIDSSWSNGIALWPTTISDLGEHDNAKITYDTVTNSGLKNGMNANGTYTSVGIMTFGDKDTIQNCIVKNSGYCGITFNGDSCLIQYNFIDTSNFEKNDGGGIYTFNQLGLNKLGSKIDHNISLHAINGIARGIYLDGGNQSVNMDVTNNTSAYNGGEGIIIGNRNVNVKYNNIFSIDRRMGAFFYNPNVTINFVGNAMYSASTFGYGGYYLAYPLDPSIMGTIDSNYYSRPNAESDVIRTLTTTYSFPAWVAATGKDANGGKTPSGITSANALLEYNATMSPVVVPLSGTYYNIKGAVFNNSVTLQPFTSEILFKATQDIIPNILHRLRIKQKLR